MNEITKAEMRKKLSNISQLQELLFGEQVAEFERKIAQSNQRQNNLEANFQKLQTSLDRKLTELETNLTQEINSVANSLDKKIKYLNIITQQNQQEIEQDLQDFSQETQEKIDSLRNNLKSQNHQLKAEITQAKLSLDRDLELLKQQLTQKLNSQLSELTTGKLSRSDLAEVLFELCLKLREPEVHFELTENLASSEPVDLILPEKKSTNNGK